MKHNRVNSVDFAIWLVCQRFDWFKINLWYIMPFFVAYLITSMLTAQCTSVIRGLKTQFLVIKHHFRSLIFPTFLVATILILSFHPYFVLFSSHCCSIRSNLKKVGPLQVCLPVFLGIHRNPKQKDFFNSRQGFLR